MIILGVETDLNSLTLEQLYQKYGTISANFDNLLKVPPTSPQILQANQVVAEQGIAVCEEMLEKTPLDNINHKITSYYKIIYFCSKMVGCLMVYLNKHPVLYNHIAGQIIFGTKLIDVFNNIPENNMPEERLEERWVALSNAHNLVATLLGYPYEGNDPHSKETKEKKMRHYSLAIEYLTKNKNPIFPDWHWHTLAILQRNYGTLMIDKNSLTEIAEKKEYFHQAISSLNNIPEKSRTHPKWELLGDCYALLCRAYCQLGQWPEAKKYQQSSIEYYIKAAELGKINYQRVHDLYEIFSRMSLEPSLLSNIFSFGKKIFSITISPYNSKATTIDAIFLQLHLEFTSSSHPPVGLYDMLLLCKLIQTTINDPAFPNGEFKKWYTQNQKLVEKILEDLKKIHQPHSLVTTLEYSPSTMLTMISRLEACESMIIEQQKIMGELEQTNKELTEKLKTPMYGDPSTSIYQTPHSLLGKRKLTFNQKIQEIKRKKGNHLRG